MTDRAAELDCPLPPADLDGRPLARVSFDLDATPLWRIHRASLDPIYYNRLAPGVTNYRFDAARGEFGVLYAAPTFAACMREAVIRERYQGMSRPHVIDEDELCSRCVSRLTVVGRRPLLLADLTGPLTVLGMDSRVFAVTNYRGPNLWSSALHAAFQDIDGLCFPSRLAGERSVAIFEGRARLEVSGSPVPLPAVPELPDFLEANGICLAPAGSWME